MKTYTVIESQGQKYLRLLVGDLESIETLFRHPDELDVPYIGTHPAGTTLREDQVRSIVQYFFAGEWHESTRDAFLEGLRRNNQVQTRTVFTDVENFHKWFHPAPEKFEESQYFLTYVKGREVQP